MVKLRYVGVMAIGLASCANFKINVVKNKVYDIPLTASKRFLVSKDWEKANEQKEVKEKVKEEKEEDKDEKLYNEYNEEDE